MFDQYRLDRLIQIEHQPHKKPARFGVTKLVGFNDVAVMCSQHAGYSSYYPYSIRTGNSQDMAEDGHGRFQLGCAEKDGL